MADQLPALRANKIVAALEKAGLQVKRQTGSHVILTKDGLKRPVVVPMHSRELPRGTLKDIIRQAGLTITEFIEHL